jgi:predicted Zn-dependent peptidase
VAKIGSSATRRLIALAAAALLAGCATRSASPKPEGYERPGASPATSPIASPAASPASSPAASPIASPAEKAPSEEARLLPEKERAPYLDTALSDYWLERLPNGTKVAIKRQAGRKTAAARIILGRGSREVESSEAGYDALAFWAALRAAGRSAFAPAAGSPEPAAFKGGSSMELKIDSDDDVAVEILCPTSDAASLLKTVADSLATRSFSQADFDAVLREARVAERRVSGDPLVRAADELRAVRYGDRPYNFPSRGTAASLARATRESVMRYWTNSFAPERLFVVVVGDFEPRTLAWELATSFGGLAPALAGGDRASGSSSENASEPPIKPWFKALPLAATPGAAVLYGEFGAPAASSADYPALAVALAMLDDLLFERMRGSKGTNGIANGSWSRLSTGATHLASVTVYKTGDPIAAKAAVDAAIADLGSGLCLDPSSRDGELGTISTSIETYKSRALAATYARSDSSADIAASIAADLASGGDGTALFRMAERIEEVKSEDVRRVARERLIDGPSAWIALGDPDLVLPLSSASFVPSRP